MWQDFKKFGLDYYDLPTMIWNVAFLMRVLTVNIDNRYKKGIPIYFYIFTLVVTASFIYVFLVSMAWFVFYRSVGTNELVPAMVVLSLGISGNIGTLKLVYMLLHIDKIRELASEYIDCDSNNTLGRRFSMNLLKTLKKVKKRAIIYWLVLVLNGAVYLIKPPFLSGRHLPTECYVVYGLEPTFESPNYELTYLLVSFGIFFICYVPASVSAYLIVIAGYTEAQMLAMSEEVLHIWSDAVAQVHSEDYYKSTSIWRDTIRSLNNAKPNEATKAVIKDNSYAINEIIKERMKDIVKRHTVILSLYMKLEDIFRGAIAMGFILLVLGITSELLGGLENTYVQMPFALMQVTMDCFVGQRVMDASVAFERAVYECKWEHFDTGNMRMVLVMLQTAQKTLTLSAGGVSTLSFNCLMAVLRAIYSAYTALRSVMKSATI